MAAKHFYLQGCLLILCYFISATALERKFSDFKRCADMECSMLLCRGRAVKDFSGPDCRFLSFKKSETIYVYYKLSGRRADMWAGSVGNSFGYFPKDLLAVNHLYTDKELEVPAEETDFVCFETGYDKFDIYDIDALLAPSMEKSDEENNETSVKNQESESSDTETQPSEERVTEIVKPIEHHDNSEDVGKVPDDQSASVPQVELNTSSPLIRDVESDAELVPDVVEEEKGQQHFGVESSLENVSERSETKKEPSTPEVESVLRGDFNEQVSVSKGMQIPELKTSLGSTFDAVVTHEESTTKVTPQEEDKEDTADHQDAVMDDGEEIPLLAFSAEDPAMDPLKKQDDKPLGEEKKNLWTSIGDTMFSVVTGGEVTAGDESSDEEDDDEEEDMKDTKSESQENLEKSEAEPLLSESQDASTTPVPQDPSHFYNMGQEVPENTNNSDRNLLSGDDESVNEVIKSEEALNETLKPTDEEPEHHQTEDSSVSMDPVSEEDIVSLLDGEKSDIKTAHENIEDKKDIEEEELESKDTEINENDDIKDSDVKAKQDLSNALDEKTVIGQESVVTRGEIDQEPSADSEVKTDQHAVDDKLPDQISVEGNKSQIGSSVEEAEIQEQSQTEEEEVVRATEMEQDDNEEKEELLEDENELFKSQSDDPHADEPPSEPKQPAESEPEYSDSVMRLTLIRDHFSEERMELVQKLLGLKNLYKIEAMFSDLDTELQATRLAQTSTMQDIEIVLDSILEASENTILDEIEKMLDHRDAKQMDEHSMDTSNLDEEMELLDDFQELAFSLRRKYSTLTDSAPLATEISLDNVHDKLQLDVEEDSPHLIEENVNNPPEIFPDDNLTATYEEEKPAKLAEEEKVPEEVTLRPDVSVEEDHKHLNENKNDQPTFTVPDEEQEAPPATVETPLDATLKAPSETEHFPLEGSVDSMRTESDTHEEESGLFTTGIVYVGCLFSVVKNKTAKWTDVMISLLPEEWKPGETLFGVPWQAVVITALVGVFTFILFFWRTILAVKKREYLVDDKKLKEQIQALIKEKTSALAKISALQKQTEQLKESQKQSKENVTSKMKRIQDLESKVSESEKINDQMIEEKNKYAKLLEEERTLSLETESRIEKLEKSKEKLQLSRKKIQEALTKTTVLLDEAKIREDARNAQQKSLQKDFTALKEENKTLKATIKSWEEKHKELNEKIKVYQRSQKELEDSVMLKDHNLEVLSDLLVDLDACGLQKGEAKVLANGEVASDKNTVIKNRIKQMMDVSRIQTTLTVVEEERDRFMAKLLNEEKSRKELEEKHQELEHTIGSLKSEKSQVESQFKILRQKNEIMVEMYQQKENALQQRLTKEELERRSKENLLSEVGGKALEAEEQVKLLRQRINEMEEQMKKTEEVYKEQIKEQENKTHSNWVNARNAERALSQEKLESSKLREKLAVLTSQLNERRAPLFRPNPGQPAGPRQGDSYGPSPVSGGAPSPPIMIEGPRRPPSAPVGRRSDPFGPRPPSDPHGCYPDNKHISGMDMMGPRSSSPANLDVTGPGSFLVSPVRDSPSPMVQGPPPGPHDPLLPPGPTVRLPPPGPYRPPRPGPYQLPPGPLPPNVPLPYHGPPLPVNGHPGMPLPGPMGGEFGPRAANGLVFHPRLGPPGPLGDPRCPPPPHFHPSMHLPPGVRGPMGPRPPVPPPDMRYQGPRDHTSPPKDMPRGVPPFPAHPGDTYSQAGPQNGPSQDPHMKQEAPQDSAMVEP
uniref:Transport and Golgi organization protein 1 homolog n=1 Tax=Nothobranchius pienaari TaxID=704102 RepID=A0A1A8LKF2_9TELE